MFFKKFPTMAKHLEKISFLLETLGESFFNTPVQ